MTATKMNICMIVSAAFPPREGMGFYVWNLSRYLIQQGHRVQIITRGSQGQAGHEEVDGVTLWRPFFAPLYPFHVHMHGLFVSKLVRALEGEVDLFHSHSPLVPPIKTKRLLLFSVHSAVLGDVPATRVTNWKTFLMKLQAPVSYWLEVQSIRRATVVSAVSPKVADLLRKYPHCPSDVPVMWNGVDTDLFKPGPDGLPKEDLIMAVGRLSPEKGLQDLIDAFSSISDQHKTIKLVIIGDGPLKHSLEQHVNSLGLNARIQFEGHLADRDRLIGFYQKASLFVLPSHYESLPTVILEAMACGCPILATRVGGVPNVIEDGVSGVLVPPRDPDRMAAALGTLLSEPEKSNMLGLQARQTIARGFSWERIGARFVDLYLNMLEKRADRRAA